MIREATENPHYINRADEPIDPHDPFQNPTEVHEYNTDYAEVVPQITLKGCRIPLIPSTNERSRIRRFYTLAGVLGAFDYFLASILAVGLYYLVSLFQRSVDSNLLGGKLPQNYSNIQSQFFSDSSIEIGINLIAFFLANTIVFLLGSKLSHIRLKDYFQDQTLPFSKILRYVAVGLFIQFAMGVAADWAYSLFEAMGHEMYVPDFSMGDSPTKMLLTVLYSCLVAPITEELVFRGVILKNLSRVSQRLGIFLSALFFALAHENIPQGLLAFVLGIFLAYITIENNSLVPAMIVHFSVNTLNTVMMILQDMQGGSFQTIYSVYVLFVLAFGTAALIYTLMTERLPATTPHQSVRGMNLALSSLGIWLFVITHVSAMLLPVLLRSVSLFFSKG